MAARAGAQTDNATPCSLRGIAQLPTNTVITAADGRPIARFSGSASPLVASSFPADAQGRALVETGTGSGSFKVRGLVETGKIPVYTAQSVPVVAGHVWIGPQRRVSVVGAAPGRLKVQKVLSYPLQQTFSTWGPCSAFTLSALTPPGWSVPGQARGYVLKRGSLDLFDAGAAGNSLVMTLLRSSEPEGLLFFSTEQRGAWVHLEYHGEVVIDAWARADELQALPRGETMDQLVSPVMQRSPAHLAVQGEPRIVKTTREVALRTSAKDGDPVIGVIEPGTETYVLDVMAGWASVMPKALNVIPAENGQFWVKAAELGI